MLRGLHGGRINAWGVASIIFDNVQDDLHVLPDAISTRRCLSIEFAHYTSALLSFYNNRQTLFKHSTRASSSKATKKQVVTKSSSLF
jgi:hypothetical protein